MKSFSTEKLRQYATSNYIYPITQFIKRSIILSRILRGSIRLYQNMTGTAPDILKELDSVEAAPPVPDAPAKRILIFTLRGWLIHMAWETTIARALHLHGAETLTILCDRILPACEPRIIVDDFDSTCDLCRSRSVEFLSKSKLPYKDLTHYLNLVELQGTFAVLEELSLQELMCFTHDGLVIGEMVGASVQRHLLQGSIDDTPKNHGIYRRFVRAGLMIQQISHQLLDSFQPDSILIVNGLFYAEAIMMSIAIDKGIPVWTYERANKRIDALIFAKDIPVIKQTFVDEWKERSRIALTEKENQQLDAYLARRRSGKTGIENLWEKMEAAEKSADDILVATLFTNVLWDTAVYKADFVFESMIHWIQHTVSWFTQHPEYRLVIRIHPAETRIPFKESRSPVIEYLPELSENIQVFDSKETVDSYELLDQSQLILVYTTTIGLEAILSGKPTIVSGQTHYNNKGFTFDPTSIDDYDQLLNDSMSKEQDIQEKITLARRYAYSYFFEEMIPFPFVIEQPMSYASLTYRDNRAFAPGKDPYIEAICHTLLEGNLPKNPTPEQL